MKDGVPAPNLRKMMKNEPQEETKQQAKNIKASGMSSNNFSELEAQLYQLQQKVEQNFQLIQPNVENIFSNNVSTVNDVQIESLSGVENRFLYKSKCATEYQQKQNLLKILGKEKLVTTLLYRGSEHGWNNKDFHTRCDNEDTTISLYKVKDGDIIGGYTTASWSSDNKFVNDRNSLLFNLSKGRYFPSKKTGKDIRCGGDLGPTFSGSQQNELSAQGAPFNAAGKCTSYANKPSFGITLDKQGKNMLTNQQDGQFTITELEVWKVL